MRTVSQKADLANESPNVFALGAAAAGGDIMTDTGSTLVAKIVAILQRRTQNPRCRVAAPPTEEKSAKLQQKREARRHSWRTKSRRFHFLKPAPTESVSNTDLRKRPFEGTDGEDPLLKELN